MWNIHLNSSQICLLALTFSPDVVSNPSSRSETFCFSYTPTKQLHMEESLCSAPSGRDKVEGSPPVNCTVTVRNCKNLAKMKPNTPRKTF